MLLNKRKETPVKFNSGLSSNRPSNNWALSLITASHVRRKFKAVLDSQSGFHAVDFEFEVLDSSCEFDSGFQSPGFQIPKVKNYRILETEFPLIGN